LSRTPYVTNGVTRYKLMSESNIVTACEALLLNYSESNDPRVRVAAASRLAHFGTTPALQRALHLARHETSPAARAALWGALAELMQTPPASHTSPTVSTGDISPHLNTNDIPEIMQILSNPELSIVIHGHRPLADFALPSGIDLSAIVKDIINQYARDDGSWTIEVVDRIPFVPFSAQHTTLRRTVRQAIAETLEWTACGDTNVIAAFQDMAKHPDKDIGIPAQRLVDALSEQEWFERRIEERQSNKAMDATRD